MAVTLVVLRAIGRCRRKRAAGSDTPSNGEKKTKTTTTKKKGWPEKRARSPSYSKVGEITHGDEEQSVISLFDEQVDRAALEAPECARSAQSTDVTSTALKPYEDPSVRSVPESGRRSWTQRKTSAEIQLYMYPLFVRSVYCTRFGEACGPLQRAVNIVLSYVACASWGGGPIWLLGLWGSCFMLACSSWYDIGDRGQGPGDFSLPLHAGVTAWWGRIALRPLSRFGPEAPGVTCTAVKPERSTGFVQSGMER
eukprot:5742436-Prymnesium_polylepis.1